jgi:hypothetical protein
MATSGPYVGVVGVGLFIPVRLRLPSDRRQALSICRGSASTPSITISHFSIRCVSDM